MNRVLLNYDFIIFDCDGVIFDTNKLKSDAFALAVKDYPKEIVEEFVKYHQQTGGISRYVKFRKFITDFLKESFSETLYNKLLNAYSQECIRIYQTASLTSGSQELFKLLKNNDKKLYVASGSDENELKESFINRNISHYFEGILGSPKSKLECVKDIKCQNNEMNGLIIGDSYADYAAANEAGLDFIFMKKFSEVSPDQYKTCTNNSILVINDLTDLLY
jgi:phosphoglycolate phosphatase-like HAD superfamily hydrolase